MTYKLEVRIVDILLFIHEVVIGIPFNLHLSELLPIMYDNRLFLVFVAGGAKEAFDTASLFVGNEQLVLFSEG